MDHQSPRYYSLMDLEACLDGRPLGPPMTPRSVLLHRLAAVLILAAGISVLALRFAAPISPVAARLFDALKTVLH